MVMNPIASKKTTKTNSTPPKKKALQKNKKPTERTERNTSVYSF